MFNSFKKRTSIFEMVVVLTILVGLLFFSWMFAINFHMHKTPLVLDIWYNFQEISFLCDAPDADGESECYKFLICPLQFKGLEYFNWTVGADWEIKWSWWDMTSSQLKNQIDLSTFAIKPTANSMWGEALNWWYVQTDWNIDTNKLSLWNLLNSSWCKIKHTRGHKLNQFKYSLSKALWDNDPKMYAINWILYDKHFQPINWAVDYESSTFIANGIIYFN